MFELEKEHYVILCKMFFTKWEYTDNQNNWLMKVVELEFTKLTGCCMFFERKRKQVPQIIQLIKKKKREMWEKLKRKLNKRVTNPVDIKTRCDVNTIMTRFTVLSVQGRAFYILHLDQKLPQQMTTATNEKKLSNRDRITLVRLFEKYGGNNLIQHVESLDEPTISTNTSLAHSSTEDASIEGFSDTASLTTSVSHSLTGSIPSEDGNKLQNSAVTMSTGLGATVASALNNTSTAASTNCNTKPKQGTVPTGEITPLKTNKKVS